MLSILLQYCFNIADTLSTCNITPKPCFTRAENTFFTTMQNG